MEVIYKEIYEIHMAWQHIYLIVTHGWICQFYFLLTSILAVLHYLKINGTFKIKIKVYTFSLDNFTTICKANFNTLLTIEVHCLSKYLQNKINTKAKIFEMFHIVLFILFYIHPNGGKLVVIIHKMMMYVLSENTSLNKWLISQPSILKQQFVLTWQTTTNVGGLLTTKSVYYAEKLLHAL